MARTIEEAFNELLGRQRLTASQVAVADGRIKALQDFFARNFTMAETAFKVGSYARGTICSGQRDVDLMAPLRYSTYKDRYDNDSRSMLYYVRKLLNDRYWATNVSSRQISVTLHFQSIAADVVACFVRSDPGGEYFIPDGNGGWLITNPKYHAQLIAAENLVQNGRLKPIIRLIKAWNLANGNHLRSFHVEILVYSIWKGHIIGSSLSQSVSATLGVMGSWVNSTCYDPWNTPSRIDDYLSAGVRKPLVTILNIDAIAASEAERYRMVGNVQEAFSKWKSIYKTSFPAYG